MSVQVFTDDWTSNFVSDFVLGPAVLVNNVTRTNKSSAVTCREGSTGVSSEVRRGNFVACVKA